MTRKLLPLALLAAGCLTAPTPSTGLIGEGTRVLFIGNSYTYINDVPGIVQAFGDAAGVPLAVATVAMPDYALIDHWNSGNAKHEVSKGGWAYVVLQQGPSSVGLNRDTLRLATKLFADETTRIGGRTALFSAWPQAGRRVDFPRAAESYRLAAEDVGGLFLPVADAWIAAWALDPNVTLYASDGLHASAAGSYLTALTIFAEIAGRSPIGLPSSVRTAMGTSITIPQATATLLQQAADQVTR